MNFILNTTDHHPISFEIGSPYNPYNSNSAMKQHLDLSPLNDATGTGFGIIPRNVRYLKEIGQSTIFVYEHAPCYYTGQWRWLDAGGFVTSQYVRIALPWMVFIGGCHLLSLPDPNDPHGTRLVSYEDEGITHLFFRNQSLKSLDDLLSCATLPNFCITEPNLCSIFRICLGSIYFGEVPRQLDISQLIAKSLQKRVSAFFHHGFNLEYRMVSTPYFIHRERISDIYPVSKWEEKTRENPNFAVSYPWPATGLSLRQAVENYHKDWANNTLCDYVSNTSNALASRFWSLRHMYAIA